MSILSTYIFFGVLILPSCFCAKILAVVPTPSHSHQIAFTPLWKELSLRGHKVTVVTTDPQNDPTLTNLTEIDTRWSYKSVASVGKVVEDSLDMWKFLDFLHRIVTEVSDAQLSYEPVQKLMRSKEGFDVLLVEVLYPEFLAFAEIYNCPTILIASFEPKTINHHLMGNPGHPVLNPDFATNFFGNLNFKERVISTVYDWYSTLYTSMKIWRSQQLLLNKYFNTTSTIEELLGNVDMMFTTTNPIIQAVRAVGPSTVAIGGNQRMMYPKPLPKDLQQFLDGAKEGFIYFSLGSNVKSKDLKKETLTAIIEALRQLPYKVLWKFEADELPGKPDNVKLIKWTPQQSVLAHPNIKLFITQGGLQSMEEAIYSEVPLVVMPFFGDQEQNAKLMVSKGIAVRVDVRPYLDKENLKKAIIEVISNPKYKNAIIRLKQLALDTPMTGLEKAVWWTEYVIRNKGAKHLRNPAADIPLYQYYLLDVIGFLIFVFVAAISVILFSVRFLLRFIASKLGLKKVSASKKLN